MEWIVILRQWNSSLPGIWYNYWVYIHLSVITWHYHFSAIMWNLRTTAHKPKHGLLKVIPSFQAATITRKTDKIFLKAAHVVEDWTKIFHIEYHSGKQFTFRFFLKHTICLVSICSSNKDSAILSSTDKRDKN